jgi:hypothetical protein
MDKMCDHKLKNGEETSASQRQPPNNITFLLHNQKSPRQQQSTLQQTCSIISKHPGQTSANTALSGRPHAWIKMKCSFLDTHCRRAKAPHLTAPLRADRVARLPGSRIFPQRASKKMPPRAARMQKRQKCASA